MKDKLVEYAERELKKKTKPEEIKQKLISAGHDPEHAEHAVSHAQKKKWHHITIYIFTVFIILLGFLAIRKLDFSPYLNNADEGEIEFTVLPPPTEDADYVKGVVDRVIAENNENLCTSELRQSVNRQLCMDNYYLNKAFKEDSVGWCSRISLQNIKDVCMKYFESK